MAEKLQGEGKAVFVTGGSRGIGRGMCEVFAENGYDVAFTYSSALEEAEKCREYVQSLGRRCFFYQASLENADVPERVTAQAIEDLGRLDVLVNNAGLTKHNYITSTDVSLMDFVYGLNFRNPLLCTKVAANHMIERGIHGSIVNITSTRGLRSYPNDSLYGASKAALARATESIATELGQHQIRVNCIAPGATAVRGDMSPESLRHGWAQKIPLQRLGTPRECGKLALYLSSEAAGYITGTVIKIDGGLILPGMPEDGRPEAGYGWGKVFQ